jgi:hypothetical protein
VAHVAINPAPLPPTVLVEFDPLPNLAATTAGMSMQQEHLTGALSKLITFPSGSLQASGSTYTLEAFYSLDASVTENVVPPSPFAAGSYMAMFSTAGTLSEILAPVAPTTGVTWILNGAISEHGNMSGALNMPSPSAPGVLMVNFTTQASFGGTATPWVLHAAIMPSWNFQANIQSSGKLVEIPPGPSLMPAPSTATFTEQDVVTACFMPPPSPFHPPGPCITIDATTNTWGSVTESMLTAATASTPEVDTGMTQYADSLTENIMFGDGSVRGVTESSQDLGIFIIAILVG